MSRPVLWFLVAIFVSPAIAYFAYRLARGLGFLDPPIDRQHDLRRTIAVSLYSLLLFLPVAFYGFEKGWPRIWILFGIVDGLALIIFAVGGAWAARELWKLRHPDPLGNDRGREPGVEFARSDSPASSVVLDAQAQDPGRSEDHGGSPAGTRT